MPVALDVVIPCYNAAATLTRAAESALAQAQVRHVWLIDDASTDHSPQIISRLTTASNRIFSARLPDNGGVSRARNWGLLQSNADYIAFLDADDAYETGALAAATVALAQHPQLGLVRLKLKAVGLPARYAGHPKLPEAWQRLEMTVGGNTVFRRSLLLACGGFPADELFKRFGGEDAALGIALTRSSIVGTLFGANEPAVLHYYRPGMHAERLLDAALFAQTAPRISAADLAAAEAVSQRISRQLTDLHACLTPPQTGIMPLFPERPPA
ncbi:glycosyltransferase family 2 protein [Uruburuella testudinis]|uniref:Glycosyltransferase family 2 protein n=1 Tax=Uruburuella testudinis TaxID=1282863 RepID=A0ABY4DVF4_9NEIS|nr:glycosyltransferase family A protein [Uruburuella testudinis]UOO83005.1 glycosyltransferase family 2 protein [Uruburuella testudinis]